MEGTQEDSEGKQKEDGIPMRTRERTELENETHLGEEKWCGCQAI